MGLILSSLLPQRRDCRDWFFEENKNDINAIQSKIELAGARLYLSGNRKKFYDVAKAGDYLHKILMKRTSHFLLVFLALVLVAAPGQATMFWRPAEAAMERVHEILDPGTPEMPDISLPGGLSEEIRARLQKSGQAMPLGPAEYPSEQLSTLAWEGLKARDVTKVEAAVFWCLEIYGEEAGKLQAEFEADDIKYLDALQPYLTAMRPLVYVGEALLALGEAYRQAGRQEEALIVYGELIRNYYLSASERR